MWPRRVCSDNPNGGASVDGDGPKGSIVRNEVQRRIVSVLLEMALNRSYLQHVWRVAKYDVQLVGHSHPTTYPPPPGMPGQFGEPFGGGGTDGKLSGGTTKGTS